MPTPSKQLLCPLCFSIAIAGGCGGRQPAGSSAHDGGGPAIREAGRADSCPDSGCGTPPPFPPPSCAPAGAPRLIVSLVKTGDGVVANVRNAGCKPAYRVHGCCNEGAPSVEVRDDAGSWSAARCSTDPHVCCAAAPTCRPLAPGATLQLRVEPLSGALCCGTTFRVGVGYHDRPDCANADDGPPRVAYSNALRLRDRDTCTSGDTTTPCGSTSCKTASEVCVQLLGLKASYACRPVPPQCGRDRSCACLGSRVCSGGAYVMCTDVKSAPNTVSCECPNC